MKKNEFPKTKNLLLVGPKPPPLGGSPLTVQAIIDELSTYDYVKLSIVNTSPSGDIRKNKSGFNFEKIWRMISLVPRYIWKLNGSTAILVFANNLFAFTTVPLLLLFARISRKSLYLKPVGGDLDLYTQSLYVPFQKLFLSILRATDGILVQTKLLQKALIGMGCTNVFYLPGFRAKPSVIDHDKKGKEKIRFIFLAHIMRPKGPLVLLDALQSLSRTCSESIVCDFYGPIHHEIRDEFVKEIEKTPSAKYCGVADPGTGTSLIAKYDVLILPTYFSCEGHTGVLIEAMHAGVPVISTQHRSIPELITNGENGILVPPKDSEALSDAIKKIIFEPELRKRLGNANALRGEEFRADKVVAQLIDILFKKNDYVNGENRKIKVGNL